MPIKLIRVNEYAEREGINIPAVYKRIKKGSIKSVKKNNLTYIEIMVENIKPEKKSEITEFKEKTNITVLEIELLKKKIEDLEKDKQREIKRGDRLEQDLRNKDKIIIDVLEKNHVEIYTALQSIGMGEISNIGLQKQMGHFDSSKNNTNNITLETEKQATPKKKGFFSRLFFGKK